MAAPPLGRALHLAGRPARRHPLRRESSTEARINTKKIEFLAPEPTQLSDIHVMTVGLPSGDEVAPNHRAIAFDWGLAL